LSRGDAVSRIVDGVREMDTGWRSVDRVIMAVNTIVLGYQVVIGKTLGKSFGGMTQMLLREVGELLSEVVDNLVGGLDYSEENLAEAIKRSLVETGIAKKVEVEELPAEIRHGRKMRRFRIRVEDSLFRPIYEVLVKKGYVEFPMSPEGLLIAAVVLRVLKKSGKDAKVNMKAVLPRSEEEDLEITIEQIEPYRG